MKLGQEFSSLEAELLADALLAVRDRLIDPQQIEPMYESMKLRYPGLGVLPRLIIDGLGHGSTEEQQAEMMKGALLVVAVLSQYADLQELGQQFPDMPIVPQPRSGT